MELDKKTRIAEKRKAGGVMGREPVSVEWGEKSKFHKKGSKSEVHKLQAVKFVKLGIAKIVSKGEV